MAPSEPSATPLVEFFQLVPSARPPRRADRSVGGVIPARALRYCEAITSASAFGWYVFLPISFKVVWDGHDMLHAVMKIVKHSSSSQLLLRWATLSSLRLECQRRGYEFFGAPSMQP